MVQADTLVKWVQDTVTDFEAFIVAARAERDERNRILMEEMRQIDIGAGEPVVIPNDAGYEQVVQDFYQDDEGPGDQNDEDEGISEN